MACKHCGSEIPENTSTCPSCGSAAGVSRISGEIRRKKKNSISFIALGCTVIALVLAIVSFFVPYAYYLQGIGIAFAAAAIVFSALNGTKNVGFLYGSIIIIFMHIGTIAYWIYQAARYW